MARCGSGGPEAPAVRPGETGPPAAGQLGCGGTGAVCLWGPRFGIRRICPGNRQGGRMTKVSMTIDGVRYDDDIEPRMLLVHRWIRRPPTTRTTSPTRT